LSDNQQKTSEECLIVLLDILGFTDMVQKDEDAKILSMLTCFSGNNVPLQYKELENTELRKSYNFYPEISSWSDQIIISFPLRMIRVIPDVNPPASLLGLITYVTNWFYIFALTRGVALRGIMHKGKLYHEGNKVFGKALLAAFDQEPNVRFPRIILSETVIKFIKENNLEWAIELTSDDNRCYLDSLKSKLILQVENKDVENIKLIKNNIEICLVNLHNEPLEKWRWLANAFNQALNHWKKSSPYYSNALKDVHEIRECSID
jgi:hypothetical protein